MGMYYHTGWVHLVPASAFFVLLEQRTSLAVYEKIATYPPSKCMGTCEVLVRVGIWVHVLKGECHE